MQSILLPDRTGPGRAAPGAGDHATFHRSVPPRNKGVRYPPDPPTVEDIMAVTVQGPR